MFDFFCDLFQEVGKKSYRYQVDSGKKIVLQGYKTVLKIEENLVVVKLADGELNVVGKQLKVAEFCTNTISIVGKIESVSVFGGADEK